MINARALAVKAAYFSGAARLLRPETGLTAILYHRFVFPNESLDFARDRLKRQCEWLRTNYTPMTQSDVVRVLGGGQFSKKPLLITIDDALVDLLDVVDVFRSFDLPITIFACAAWCADDSGPDRDTLLARLVNRLEWYDGPNKVVLADDGRLKIDVNQKANTVAIDQVLNHKNAWRPFLDIVLTKLDEGVKENSDRKCCTWEELADLKGAGAGIGCHSVSHIRLADATPTRLDFEISEAKRILKAYLGDCNAFAYPYGMWGTFNQLTTAALKRAGFEIAFLTIAGFAGADTDFFHVPRIPLPDRPLTFDEFRARVGGGGVVIAKAMEFFRGIPQR